MPLRQNHSLPRFPFMSRSAFSKVKDFSYVLQEDNFEIFDSSLAVKLIKFFDLNQRKRTLF
ncbi:unnamed protein product [Paramecium octaurelia]|uniref:Uncharacterized protein n=1 Tax=Paramecium octaurelia TaxID=43137 RepID=A0A8S1VTS5_PAROT|nr:unnamed protein product [Paramecium octaurelia]